MPKPKAKLSIAAAQDVDERDTRTPAVDQRGEGTQIQFAVAAFIAREAQVLYDQGRFAAVETKNDLYRLIFVEGLQQVMSWQVRPGFYQQLRLAQRVLEDEDAEQFFGKHLAAIQTRVDELLSRGEKARAKRTVQRQMEILLETQDTGELGEQVKARELADRLAVQFGNLLLSD